MGTWEHLQTLDGIAYYKAPDNTKIYPATIAPGRELVEVITDGGVWFDVEGEDRPFTAGSIFWHREGEQTIHRCLPDRPYRCMCFQFVVNAPSGQEVPSVSMWSQAHDAITFCWDAFNAFHSGRWSLPALAMMCYGRLLWEGRNVAHEKQPVLPAAVLKTMTWIERHISDPLSVETLALEADVSVPHLHALFKEHLNTTPHKAVLQRKLIHARTLLSTTSQSVKNISAECGFGGVETFCRAFRKAYGQTPTEFRHYYP